MPTEIAFQATISKNKEIVMCVVKRTAVIIVNRLRQQGWRLCHTFSEVATNKTKISQTSEVLAGTRELSHTSWLL